MDKWIPARGAGMTRCFNSQFIRNRPLVKKLSGKTKPGFTLALLNEVSQLHGLKVGAVAAFGSPASAVNNTQISFVEVRQGVQNFKMLQAGRNDAILAFARIGLATTKESGEKKDTDLLLNAENIAIAEMIKDGTYHHLLTGFENQSIFSDHHIHSP